METFNYRENIWQLKMAQIIHSNFNYKHETQKSGAQWAFNGTCGELQAILNNFLAIKVQSTN